MTDLEKNIATLAEEEGKTELEIITELQTAAAAIGNEQLLDELSEIKWNKFVAPKLNS